MDEVDKSYGSESYGNESNESDVNESFVNKSYGNESDGNESDGNECCAICLEEIGTNACHLECTHVFHSHCLLKVACAYNDARCPTCRTPLVAPPTTQPSSSAPINSNRIYEVTLADIEAVIRDDEWAELRRQQINWDARKRRFLRSRPRLMQENDAVRVITRELRGVETEVQRLWHAQSRALWNSATFDGVRQNRARLLRALARKRRVVDLAVTAELGPRPEIDSDDDDVSSETIARAIAHAASRTIRENEQV